MAKMGLYHNNLGTFAREAGQEAVASPEFSADAIFVDRVADDKGTTLTSCSRVFFWQRARTHLDTKSSL